jgi:hypothetical protein
LFNKTGSRKKEKKPALLTWHPLATLPTMHHNDLRQLQHQFDPISISRNLNEKNSETNIFTGGAPGAGRSSTA